MTLPIEADPAQQDIDRIASAWLIRIEEEGLDPAATRDFERWIASDPRHESTYEALRRTWSDIAAVPGLETLAPSHAAGPSARRAWSPARAPWRWAAGIGLAASLVAGLVLFDGAPSAPHYRTQVAEMREVALPDGSHVTIGAHSAISLAYTAGERRVILSSGEALFDVRHDARRPFVVDAGSSLIRDVGTKFDVNRTADSIRVGVLEGRVEVSRIRGGTARPLSIGGGQGVQIVEATSAGMTTGPSSSGQILVTSQNAAGAWRDGRLVFDNVRLADLSADVNRYYAPGVALGSAAVGEMRVTAAFKTSEIPAFMAALDATLPVRTERDADGGFRIVDARR